MFYKDMNTLKIQRFLVTDIAKRKAAQEGQMYMTELGGQAARTGGFGGSRQAILEGQAAGDVLVLMSVGLACFILALIFFQIRKLTVGVWPWQRGKVEA